MDHSIYLYIYIASYPLIANTYIKAISAKGVSFTMFLHQNFTAASYNILSLKRPMPPLSHPSIHIPYILVAAFIAAAAAWTAFVENIVPHFRTILNNGAILALLLKPTR